MRFVNFQADSGGDEGGTKEACFLHGKLLFEPHVMRARISSLCSGFLRLFRPLSVDAELPTPGDFDPGAKLRINIEIRLREGSGFLWQYHWVPESQAACEGLKSPTHPLTRSLGTSQ